MASVSRAEFLTEFGRAMREGEAAAFVGAGLSRAAGFVDWKELLRDFAQDLNLDLEIEQDLTLVAQYHLNREPAQSRERLHAKLVAEFSAEAELSPAHLGLAKLPLDLVWTSNYDTLVERAFTQAGRKVRVKKSAGTLVEQGPRGETTVFKLHGDLSDPETIVLTRDDYRNYAKRYPGFRDRLRSDLAERTFVFLGFSFEDPHLDLILNELRLSFDGAPRPHFVIMRRARNGRKGTKRYGYARNRQTLKIEDLSTFGIRTLLVDEFEEIYDLLRELDYQLRRARVFVSGAAHDYNPKGREWLDELATSLGRQLIASGVDIVSGFGQGIGPQLLSGALEQLYNEEVSNIDRRLVLKPFPYASSRRDLIAKHRADLLATPGFVVFLSGNKLGADGTTLSSDGVQDEFRIAVANGAIPLPVGSTGWKAEELWHIVKGNWSNYMPARASKRDFNILNRSSADVREVLGALARLMASNRTSLS